MHLIIRYFIKVLRLVCNTNERLDKNYIIDPRRKSLTVFLPVGKPNERKFHVVGVKVSDRKWCNPISRGKNHLRVLENAVIFAKKKAFKRATTRSHVFGDHTYILVGDSYSKTCMKLTGKRVWSDRTTEMTVIFRKSQALRKIKEFLYNLYYKRYKNIIRAAEKKLGKRIKAYGKVLERANVFGEIADSLQYAYVMLTKPT